jgi:hypothetical protein
MAAFGTVARVLKTRKPGPKDQVSNTGYRSKAPPESVGGEVGISTRTSIPDGYRMILD